MPYAIKLLPLKKFLKSVTFSVRDLNQDMQQVHPALTTNKELQKQFSSMKISTLQQFCLCIDLEKVS